MKSQPNTPVFGIWKRRLADDSLAADARCRRMLGLPAEAAVRWADWIGRLPGEWQDNFDLEWICVIHGLVPELDFTFPLDDSRGHRRWLRALGVADRHPRGGCVAVKGIVVDMTDQCDRESQLREAEARFRGLIERSPEAIAVHRAGRVLYANPALHRLLGHPEDALAGAPLLGLVARESRRHLALALTPQGELRPVELELRTSDDRRLVLEAISQDLPFDGGPATCTLLRDLTDRKAAEARLNQAERMATVGRLAAGVAHEVNNPLMYTLLAVQGLLEEMPALGTRLARMRTRLEATVGPERAAALWGDLDLPDEAQPLSDVVSRLQEAEDGATRVRDIVQSLRTFARPEPGPPEPVVPRPVIDAALQMTEHVLRFRAAVQVDCDDSAVAMAHPGRLTQVLVNLLVNAADALETPPGAVPVRSVIQVDWRRVGERVCLSVTDAGRGIPPELRGRIFDPFFTTKEPGQGTGLGLAVCDGVVRSYGGSIDVESEVGRGTTFRVYLPPAPAAAPRVDEPVPAAESGETRPAAEPAARVLVIDDEVLAGRSLMRALRREASVISVTGGAEAIELLTGDRRFDLILCDVMMPGVNGPRLHGWVAQNAPELLSRIVFITGDATTAETRAFLEQVPNRTLLKPIPLDLLRSLARAAVLARLSDDAAAAARERRRAPRLPAPGVTGLIRFGGEVLPVSLVDWSASGFRAHPLLPPAERGTGERGDVLMCREGDRQPLRLGVTLRRWHGTAPAADVCVEISESDPEARRAYTGWLSAPGPGTSQDLGPILGRSLHSANA